MARFFFTDGPVCPSRHHIKTLSVNQRTRVRLLGPVVSSPVHYDGKTVPHFTNGECKYCHLPLRWQGFAPVVTSIANRVEQRVLLIPEGAIGYFTPDLVGWVLTLVRRQEGRVNRLFIEAREPSDLPLPPAFDVREVMDAYWGGVDLANYADSPAISTDAARS